MTRRRRSRSRLGLALLLGAALLLAAEVVVRVAGLVDVDAGVATEEQATFYRSSMFEAVDDAAVAYRNRPSATVRAGDVEYRHDARGWRVTPGGGPDAPGVAFLGDSTTYGWGVADHLTLPAQVARALDGRIRPLNLGVMGYGTHQELSLYRSHAAGLVDVPVVVLVFYPNDSVRHTFLWDDRHGALYVDALPVPHGLKPWLWRSGLYRALVSWHADRLEARGELSPESAGNVDFMLDAMEALADACRADGRRLVVAHLPGMVSLDPYPFDDVVDQVRRRAEAAGATFVDLLPGFLAERERLVAEYQAQTGAPVEDLAYRNFLSRYWIEPDGSDQHLDGEAYRLAAETLAPVVDRLLP